MLRRPRHLASNTISVRNIDSTSVRVDDDASDGLACSSGDQQDTTSVFDALLPPQPTKATICSAGIQHSASTQTF